jgi:Icc-related predicted phosphoesterase
MASAASETTHACRTKKTRFLIISDTHSAIPYPEEDTEHAFRWPLPEADVLLHCGDLTGNGALEQHERTVEMIKKAPAKLKIVIPGNHDITLDETYYERDWILHGRASGKQDLHAIRKLYTSPEAAEARLVYMEEGTRRFTVNGVRFTIYASAYTPEFYNWAFAYQRNEDRFNCHADPVHPVPDHGEVDIMMTHGPPFGILDETRREVMVGCENLYSAVLRCRPRLHAFGHIHEAWGAVRMDWGSHVADHFVVPDREKLVRDSAAFVDLSKDGGKPLEFGKETLFVNASIMNIQYDPMNAPFVVDLDLPRASP